MKLSSIEVPEFGISQLQPIIEEKIFNERLDNLKEKLLKENYGCAIIYADREHFANMHYISNFDPRFEEAILIINLEEDESILITGPENQGYSAVSKINIKKINYPTFGLLSQDRSAKISIEEIFNDSIKIKNKKIGIVGWKYFTSDEFKQPDKQFDIPHYILQSIQNIVEDINLINNITHWFNNPSNGFRIQNELDELALMEYSSCHTSNSLKNVIKNLKVGVSEFEAASNFKPIGIPLSCHLMLSSGERVKYGLSSPSSKIIKKGEPFAAAYGVWGSLNCRVGWIAENENDLPINVRDYFDKLVKPYCNAVKRWYENIGIDVYGGKIYETVMDILGDPFYGVELNPGHLIHKDEWLSSPIFYKSDIKFKSRQAIQMDIIPATNSEYFSSNLEDGIFLLDESDRSLFSKQYPEAMDRIIKRREFMINKLGINLKPEVMPLSNIPAVISPFLLNFNNIVEFK